jgi:protein involved in polysaccharide export with SLBB domain
MTMRLLLTISVASLCASLLAAQGPERATLATRDRLTAELARLEAQNNSGARVQAALIRDRLANGDFQVGDRILIRVDGEPQLSDTFTVQAGPALELPQLDTVSLRGVLRAELANHLQTELARYLRNPVVHVELLVRLLVEGDVARPGYYAAAPRQSLTDVLAQAGGLGARAKPSGMRVERGKDLILSGQSLQDALARGSTLDQLSLRAGDKLSVPSRGDAERTWRILAIIVTMPVAIYSLTRIR